MELKRIVAGIDGSAAAARAVAWAESLATATGAELVVVHAVEPEEATVPPVPERSQAEAERQVVDEWLPAAGLPFVPARAVPGDARHVLATAALELEADLLVVGAHGKGSVHGVVLGSVPHHLAHHAGCPLAVVTRGSDPPAGGTVVVGVDGSKANQAALEWAAAVAGRIGGRLHAVYAYDPLADSYPHPHLDNWVYRGEVDVRAEVEEIAAAGVPVELTLVGAGAVAALDAAAERDRAAFIVVGTRGRATFGGVRLGRVPDRLLRHTRHTVVVVPH